MIPIISSIFFLLNISSPFNNIISVRKLISVNVQGVTEMYYIDNDLDEIFCVNYRANSFIDFLAYLTKLGVEYTVSGKYIIFEYRKKSKWQKKKLRY